MIMHLYWTQGHTPYRTPDGLAWDYGGVWVGSYADGCIVMVFRAANDR